MERILILFKYCAQQTGYVPIPPMASEEANPQELASVPLMGVIR